MFKVRRESKSRAPNRNSDIVAVSRLIRREAKREVNRAKCWLAPLDSTINTGINCRLARYAPYQHALKLLDGGSLRIAIQQRAFATRMMHATGSMSYATVEGGH